MVGIMQNTANERARPAIMCKMFHCVYVCVRVFVVVYPNGTTYRRVSNGSVFTEMTHVRIGMEKVFRIYLLRPLKQKIA
jgi:(2Fe-2S) ferredoxin